MLHSAIITAAAKAIEWFHSIRMYDNGVRTNIVLYNAPLLEALGPHTDLE